MKKSWAFAPEMVMDEIVVGAFGAPVRVTDFGALLLPTETLPQFKEVGLTVTDGLANACAGTMASIAVISSIARLKGAMKRLVKEVKEKHWYMMQDVCVGSA
jgi:hypothetical protein